MRRVSGLMMISRSTMNYRSAQEDRAAQPRPALRATRPNEKWSMDFVAARLLDGRWFRVLTVVDQFMRECLLLLADSSLTGQRVAGMVVR
jgi:putative transposase